MRQVVCARRDDAEPDRGWGPAEAALDAGDGAVGGDAVVLDQHEAAFAYARAGEEVDHAAGFVVQVDAAGGFVGHGDDRAGAGEER